MIDPKDEEISLLMLPSSVSDNSFDEINDALSSPFYSCIVSENYLKFLSQRKFFFFNQKKKKVF